MAPGVSNTFEHDLHDLLDYLPGRGKRGMHMEPGIEAVASDIAGRSLCRGERMNILSHFVVLTHNAKLNFLDLCQCPGQLAIEQHVAAALKAQAYSGQGL